MTKPVRLRFAPSPTGPLHIGGIRTALYNYLLAKKLGGTMILRIEDTDSQRFTPGAEKYILESLEWAGIKYSEGPDIGGPYAPYRQSERRGIYLDYVINLIESGYAYYAFDTPESLEKVRSEYKERDEVFYYGPRTRDLMDNSLGLTQEEITERLETSQWTVRFKMPENQDIEMTDLIRGHIVINTSVLDDKVLYKSSDALPTYHLANVVDDRLMEISHVVRGEEWLPSLPLHYLLYQAFGWEVPEFAHLPLILGPEGKGKLSKRDAEKYGFSVYPIAWENTLGFRELGFIPEAFINTLALLGWNPGTEQEIFGMTDLTETFDLSRVSKGGARFQYSKAKWFNAQWIAGLGGKELYTRALPFLEQSGIDMPLESDVLDLMKHRVSLLTDFPELVKYFWIAPKEYDPDYFSKYATPENMLMLEYFKEDLKDSFTDPGLEFYIKEWASQRGYKLGQVMNTLRLALIGKGIGPGIHDVIVRLGKDEVIARINRFQGRC